MAIDYLVKYVCDNNATHVMITSGPTPDGWVQMVPSWGDGSGKNFDTMACASTWYDANTPF